MDADVISLCDGDQSYAGVPLGGRWVLCLGETNKIQKFLPYLPSHRGRFCPIGTLVNLTEDLCLLLSRRSIAPRITKRGTRGLPLPLLTIPISLSSILSHLPASIGRTSAAQLL